MYSEKLKWKKMYSLAIYYRSFNPTMKFYLSTRHFCINRFKTWCLVHMDLYNIYLLSNWLRIQTIYPIVYTLKNANLKNQHSLYIFNCKHHTWTHLFSLYRSNNKIVNAFLFNCNIPYIDVHVYLRTRNNNNTGHYTT